MSESTFRVMFEVEVDISTLLTVVAARAPNDTELGLRPGLALLWSIAKP